MHVYYVHLYTLESLPPTALLSYCTWYMPLFSPNNCESNCDTLPHLLHHYKHLQILSIYDVLRTWFANLFAHLTVISILYQIWIMRRKRGRVIASQCVVETAAGAICTERIFRNIVYIVQNVQGLLNFIVKLLHHETTCGAFTVVWTWRFIINQISIS